ncbi:MAG: asparagine synthase (glutamine-hydrolyzing) [SAR324 cluster bacterium]|nr:asparagine synthase (glutamine-hydrolyzing) [SAR324 cluster bacterium]
MCGIFGFCVGPEPMPQGFDTALLRAATRELAHRGPDAEGLLGVTVDGQRLHDDELTAQALTLGLGHRRLSILDLSAAGRQPMAGPHGTWLIHNGEIYNFQDLRTELTGLGYRFETATDSEVILAAYDAWGTGCVDRFNGMWAFAIYDHPRQSLFLSRDRLGIKPLYYTHREGRFAFASEIAPLLMLPGMRPRIVPRNLIRYLVDHRIDDGEETIYEQIHELRGGHCLTIDLHSWQYRSWRYWDLPQQPDLELSDEEALDSFSEIIEDALRLRLIADVPVAITLSGGVDSSVLAVAASRVRGRGIMTFTSRFPDNPAIDESAYAGQVTRACGIDAHFIAPDLGRMLEEEPRLTRHQAMPFASLSLYVHWAILSSIRQEGIPVVISGQGGDENFLGYERYYVSVALGYLPNIYRMLRHMVAASRHSRLSMRSMLAYLVYFTLPRLQRMIRLSRTRNIYRRGLFSKLGEPIPEIVRDQRHLHAAELQTNTLPTLLRYDDRTAGALGMETRLPFLDYRLVELAHRLPLRHKMRDGWTKYLPRRYLARHVPESVAWRTHKLGFNAPQQSWTDALVKARGEALAKSSFANSLLRGDMGLSDLPAARRWDPYNILHLADLLHWEWAE